MRVAGIRYRTMHTGERTPVGEFKHQIATGKFYLTDHISNVALQPAIASDGTVRTCQILRRSLPVWHSGKTWVRKAP